MNRLVAVAIVSACLASSRCWSAAPSEGVTRLAQAQSAGASSSSGRVRTASNPKELMSLLGSAKPGDTVALKAGTYSGLGFDGLNFSGTVTIISADPANPAVLTDFNVGNSSNLTFQDLTLYANVVRGYTAFGIGKSHDIAFNRVSVHGSLDGDPQNDQWGIRLTDSSNVAVTNSEFQELSIAFQASTSSNITFSGNYVHNIAVDGMEMAAVNGVKVLNNFYTDFHVAPADHPDAIQLWTDNVEGSSNVTISGNVITRGNGNIGQQGVFMDDGNNKIYSNITITNNLLIGTGYNGIALSGTPTAKATGVTITGNELWSFDADTLRTWIRLDHTEGAVVRDNRAFEYVLPGATNARLVSSNNKSNRQVDRPGNQALQAWLQAHPEMAWVTGGHPRR